MILGKSLFVALVHLYFHSTLASDSTLPPPTVANGESCGAGHVTLRASSSITDSNLLFEWYGANDEGHLEFIGVTKNGEFITDYLIESTVFYVGVSLEKESSELVPVLAKINNTAIIGEAPNIQICGSVQLSAFSTLFSSDLQYQLQRLVPQETGTPLYEDIGDISNESVFDVFNPGFYRISVIEPLSGCKAITGDIEVTENPIIYANIEGPDIKCYLLENPYTHSLELISEYEGRDFTEFTWEFSVDNVNWNVIHQGMGMEASKTTFPKINEINTSGQSTFFRLTVKEQYCELTSESHEVVWYHMPEGEIQHVNESIDSDDFFFCSDYGKDSRTLRITDLDLLPDNWSIEWYRGVWMSGLSLEYIKNQLRFQNPYDPNFSSYFSQMEWIGAGNEIVLENGIGGLIFALFTNDDTGCSNWSSNAIFADHGFAIPVTDNRLAYSDINLICAGYELMEFNSYDLSVNSYTWQKWNIDAKNFENISTNQPLILEATPPASIAGTYRLTTEKNGCYDTSQVFIVNESLPVEAKISATINNDPFVSGSAICPMEKVILTSVYKDIDFEYLWIKQGSEELGSKSFQEISEPGIYYLELTNGACTQLSSPFEIKAEATPSTVLNIDPENEEPICETTLIELVETNDTDTYQWLMSPHEDRLIFDELADETNSDYLVTNPGFYAVRITNEAGCSVHSDTISVLSIIDSKVLESNICGSSDHAYLSASNPIQGNSYEWFFSETIEGQYFPAEGVNNMFDYLAYKKGFYYLKVSNSECYSESGVFEVIQSTNEEDTFEARIEGDQSVCLGEQVVLEATFNEPDTEYIWEYSLNSTDYHRFVGENEFDLSFSSDRFNNLLQGISEKEILFRLIVKNEQCSAQSDPHSLTIVQPPIVEIRHSATETNDIVFCNNEELNEITLEAFQVTTNISGLSYQWSRFNPISDEFELLDEANQKSFQPSTAGRYRAEISTSNGNCTVLSNEINVIGLLDNVIVGSNNFCAGSPIELAFDLGYLPHFVLKSLTFKWYHSSTSSFDNATELEGDFTNSITLDPISNFYKSGFFFSQVSLNTCEYVTPGFLVEENENSFEIQIVGATKQQPGVPFELTAIATDPNINYIAWQPSEYFIDPNKERVVVTIPEDYESVGNQIVLNVLMSSNNGCSLTETIAISLYSSGEPIFPKLLTPNNDGINDQFIIVNMDETSSNNLKILNSWGIEIVNIENYRNDQKQSDLLLAELQTEGIYYFIFTENTTEIKGSFYLKK